MICGMSYKTYMDITYPDIFRVYKVKMPKDIKMSYRIRLTLDQD